LVSGDGVKIKKCDINTKNCSLSFKGHDKFITVVDRTHVASGFSDNMIKIFDMKNIRAMSL